MTPTGSESAAEARPAPRRGPTYWLRWLVGSVWSYERGQFVWLKRNLWALGLVCAFLPVIGIVGVKDLHTAATAKATTTGTIISTDCSDLTQRSADCHDAISYEVDGIAYTAHDPVDSRLGIGDTTTVHYDTRHPGVSRAGSNDMSMAIGETGLGLVAIAIDIWLLHRLWRWWGRRKSQAQWRGEDQPSDA